MGFFNDPAPPESFDFIVDGGASSIGPIFGPSPQLLTIGPTGSGSLASAYVGDSPGLAIAVSMFGISSNNDPWLFAVVWSRTLLDATALWPGPYPSTDPAGNLVAIEAYMGDDDCVIFDNLPVIAPYASIWVGPQDPASVNGVSFGSGQVTTSASNLRGPVALPLMPGPLNGLPSGYFINEPLAAVPANTTKSFYSPVLAPGIHQLYLEADVATPTGLGFAQFEYPIDQFPTLMAEAIQILDGRKQFMGSVLVPNIQPRIRFINNTAAAINMTGVLVRPAGSST